MEDANLLQLAGKIGQFSQDHRQPKCRATTRGQTAVACPMLASSQIGGAGTVFHLLTSVCIPILALAAAQELITKRVAASRSQRS
jgi:hypothetical protein